jgi:DNA polymerase III delta prime subunit
MIGQEQARKKLEINYLNPIKFGVGKVPRFTLIHGRKGQGKKTLAAWLFRQVGEPYTIKSLKIDSVREMIEDSLTLHTLKFYFIPDMDEMSIGAQNALLKFLEEPSYHAYIVATCNDARDIVSPITSRANNLYMDSYSKAELAEATSNRELINICENIGQIKRLEATDFELMKNTCNKLVENIQNVNTANLFKIVNYFPIEDADLFLLVLEKTLLNNLLSNLDKNRMGDVLKINNGLRTIYNARRELGMKSSNKQSAVEVFLIKLQEALS